MIKGEKMKLAIDVILLPPDNIMDEAIKVNKQMLEKYPNEIVLDKESCLPHISLFMAVIEEEKLSEIAIFLEEISKDFNSIKLEAFETGNWKTPDGFFTPGFKLRKTIELSNLHSLIAKKVNLINSADATKKEFFPTNNFYESDALWVNSFFEKGSFDNYNPHITIGVGKFQYDNYPFKFTSSRLAICHLGSFCTCRKILFETKLQ